MMISFDIFSNNKNKDNKDINIKLPWVEKYRPKNSNEIVLEPFIKTKIDKIFISNII